MTDRPTELKGEQLPTRPGKQSQMQQQPQTNAPYIKGSGLLENKVAVITGGDSGIGRSIAVLYAREGAHVAVVYLNENKDAATTKQLIEQEGGACELIKGDVADSVFCDKVIHQTIERFGKIDILVNNAAEQHPQESIAAITDQQLQRTFATNIFSMFYLVRAAVKFMPKGSSIINTASVTAYKGQPQLLDYSATKGAIIAFTRSLSLALAGEGIRVNAVAPGPIWTPLIPSTFPKEKVESFGKDTPMGRPGQPEEVAPSYVFLASEGASYMSGQTLHPNGGTVVNG
ncbi:MAG TPA: SDR family oxidoreductase [Candidatus Saccharimonadales bacterium]|nr:SDR family oxidoreductase [Candidatus Saccharimonadales bacterium]